MVTAISLARWQRDDLSPGSPSYFISHSTGWLCVKNTLTLWEHGSFSWRQGSLLLEPGGTIDFYSYRYLDCIRIPLIYSCWRIVACFRFLSLPSHFLGIGTLNVVYFPLWDYTIDGDPVCLNSYVWSHNRLRLSCYSSPCRLVKRIGILQEALDFV